MTNKHEFTVKFVTPDEVEKENVLLVLREFLGDLIQTERFIDAVVRVDGANLNEGEEQRLDEMLENLSEEDFEKMTEFIDSLDESE